MNKQNRMDYGNAQNTLPTVKSIPNPMANGVAGKSPALKPVTHPRRGGGSGSKNKL
jgi:hypothetical protein